jgi:hypothetical protein
MPNPNLILLYVADTVKSASFYSDLSGSFTAITYIRETAHTA